MKASSFVCLALAGAAFIATPVLAAEQQEPATYSAQLEQNRAEQAAVRGDWTAAAKLDAQSYRESPSVSNEFNLAAAYTHTGQSALAIPLYQDVAENGGRRTAFALYDDRAGSPVGAREFNYAQEATRRLGVLTNQPVTTASYYGVH